MDNKRTIRVREIVLPRTERPVDPSQGPTQRFAAELRALRDTAGRPSYRELAGRAHFSKATLSAAAGGHRLPTWEVTRAYVDACGGDVDQWRERWDAARADLGLPLPTVDVPPVQSPGLPVAGRTLAFAGIGIVILLVGLTAWMGRDRDPATSTPAVTTSPGEMSARFVGSQEPTTDGADPKRAGCSYDDAVTTLDSVEVNTTDNHFLGAAELRYSPACRAAWGRFTPGEAMTYLNSAAVTILARRPTTGTETSFETYFDGQAVFGNILLEDGGCIEVVVVIRSAEGVTSGTTGCAPPR